MEFVKFPSPPSRLSSKNKRAATKIQKQVRGKQTRKQQAKKLSATRRIQSRFRGKQTRKVMKRVKEKILTGEDCSLCLEPLDPTDKTTKITTLLPCGHRFHSECIKKAFANNRRIRCPNCMGPVTNIEPQRLPIQLTQYEVRHLELNTRITQLEQQIEQLRQQIRDPNISTDQALTRAMEIERATYTIYNECDSQLRDYIRFQTWMGNEEYEYENNPEYQSLENIFADAHHISVEAGELLDETYALVQSL